MKKTVGFFCYLLVLFSSAPAQDIPLNDNWNTSESIQITPRIAKHLTGPMICTWTDFRHDAAYSDIYICNFWDGKAILLPAN